MACGPCGQRALYLIGEPVYDPTHEYVAGDYVVVAGVLYKSLQSNNEGHNPQESPSWWTPTTILQELEGGGASIIPESPLQLSGTVLSITGITGFGTAGELVGTTGSAWGYVGTVGSGPVVRQTGAALVSPSMTGTISLGNADSLIGIFGATPTEQPVVSYTAFPNPVTDTGTFLSLANQMLQAMLNTGLVRNG